MQAHLFVIEPGRHPGVALTEGMLLADGEGGVILPVPAQPVAHVHKVLVVDVVQLPGTPTCRTCAPGAGNMEISNIKL